ncbi:MAG: ribokinase [Acidobacteriota bacterium]|nr:ribokinase [Acidobacteriota bacterium]
MVVGSLNADLVQRVERFPRPGETIVASDLTIIPGGKGANQAYAAGLLGASVKMVGQVGNDPFGPMLIENLQKANVDTRRVRVSETATGTAAILVLSSGENVIIISPGANGRLTPEVLAGRLDAIESGSVVLAQLEVPLVTTKMVLETARKRGATTILDPAPAQELPGEVLELVDFLTPNQTEAALLLQSSREIESYEEAEQAAKSLLGRGPWTVVLKIGQLGVVIASPQGVERVPSFPVRPVDSTAAGDTFNGAFAAALTEGKPVVEAARFANAAAAISVTRHGAQSSIPERAEVDELLRKA